MDEVAGIAKLVEAEALEAEGDAPTATLSHSEIEAALKDNGSADLLLEIARIEDGARDDRTLKVSWEPSDLEELLRSSGDRVTLRFDRAELERMLDTPEVEAHGLREKALVLTVAAATAGGMAGVAKAYPADSRTQPSTPAAAQAAANVQPNMLRDYPMGRALLAKEHATPAGGGGSSVPESAVEATLAGGLALLIGAAFVGRSQRRRARPA